MRPLSNLAQHRPLSLFFATLLVAGAALPAAAQQQTGRPDKTQILHRDTRTSGGGGSHGNPKVEHQTPPAGGGGSGHGNYDRGGRGGSGHGGYSHGGSGHGGYSHGGYSRGGYHRGRSSIHLGIGLNFGDPWFRPYYYPYGYSYPYGYLYYPYEYPYYRPYYRPYPYRAGDYDGDFGALDLNVRPKDTRVYIDGNYIGTADQYDGFPRYLWLEEGSYQVIFYNPGFSTVVHDYTVYPGVVIKVKENLLPGESVTPEELAAAPGAGDDYGPPPYASEPRYAEPRYPEPPRNPPAYAPGGGALDVRAAPGQVRLSVVPEDASVYVDGRFVGTAGQIEEAHAGLLLDPGPHRIEVVHPGFRSSERDVTVEAGSELTVDVRLERR